MKIYLTTPDGETRKCKLPFEGATKVYATGSCPKCKLEPFPVRGHGASRESRDTYRARATCCGCGVEVGVLRTQVSTVFGIEEDERVLNGPWRVY